MKIINAGKISAAVAQLCLKANYSLRSDVLAKIKSAYKNEADRKAKAALKAIVDNAEIARRDKLAICQDTGLPIVFAEIGQDVRIKGDLRKAIDKGIVKGYKQGSFRESIVCNPLKRDKSSHQGAVIHTEIVKGDKIKITVMPKGFGCENKSILKMFLPTAGIDEIKDFVIETVRNVGPDACPPYVVGVGIGGGADLACLMSKKALLRRITIYGLRITDYVSKIESDLLDDINKLKIGPMGLGGKATALAVNIETYPTHIAGLPVAVNLSCHALRSATKIL
ncbi:MAG: fumarate hydratase [Candidatus Omnitrophica bacterium]|nr:fumarate hydratase [Candidatus Omnitrophota bacterium]